MSFRDLEGERLVKDIKEYLPQREDIKGGIP
jgi:hypothetical protein